MLNELVRTAFSAFAILGLQPDEPGLIIWVGLLFAGPLFGLIVLVILDFVHRLTSRRYYLHCLDCQYAGHTHTLLTRCPRCGGAVTYPRSGRVLPASGRPSEDAFHGGR